MNLAAKRCAWLRDDFVMRLGAFLMVIGLLFSLVNPPKAKAIAVSATVVTVAACFLASCGITWLVQGADETGFNDAVSGLLQDYLNVEFAGQTVTEWAGDFTGIAMSGSKLMLPKLIAQKLGAFAGWVVNKYSLTAGGTPSVIKPGSPSLTCADGSAFQFSSYNYDTGVYGGNYIEPGVDLILASGAKFLWNGLTLEFFLADGKYYSGFTFVDHNGTDYTVYSRAALLYNAASNTFSVCNQMLQKDGSAFYSFTYSWDKMRSVSISLLGDVVNAGLIAIAPKAIDIPDTSTMADNESIAIDTAITAGTTAELLQRILDAIMAGTLTATKEIAKEEPKPGEITDVNELGLPALKLVLTTRFPFSIPWDVGRAIKLLVAPAKTPYFEVDFMAPIAKRFPGGFKGSTKIVLDFEQYAIIGTVSRWTSTIGFCLALAGGTKRLIWVG